MSIWCFVGWHSWNVVLKADFEGDIRLSRGYLAFQDGTPKVSLDKGFRVRVKPYLKDRYCPLCGKLDLGLTQALIVWNKDRKGGKTRHELALDAVTRGQQTALGVAGLDNWREIIRDNPG